MSPGAWVGLISDTHGLLRPQAVDALRGAGAIVHAGDVGDGEVLGRLRALAPVTAVRGNVDREEPCRSLPETAAVPWDAYVLYVIHDVSALDLDPGAGRFAGIRPEVRGKRKMA